MMRGYLFFLGKDFFCTGGGGVGDLGRRGLTGILSRRESSMNCLMDRLSGVLEVQ